MDRHHDAGLSSDQGLNEQSVAQVHWHVPVEELSLRRWGDEIVVRNAATGGTHLLTGLLREVFDRVLQSPDGLPAGSLADPEPPGEFHALLAYLESLDLIRRDTRE